MFKKTILAVIAIAAIVISIALYYRPANLQKSAYFKTRPVKRVLILGNSIVRHGPRPEIGWTHNYGMAASAIDSDFVHILIRNIKAKDSTCEIMYENIADFEAGYWNWDYAKADTFARFNADMIIMRIAENVNDHLAEDSGFINHYEKLLNRVDSGHRAMIFVCNGWWENEHVNRLLQEYAEDHNYPFIDQAGLNTVATKALGQYLDKGIQQHPNNLGMRLIAESIWGEIKEYF